MDKNRLKIREYAILTRIPKNAMALKPQKQNYSLLGQETYDSDIIETSINRGKHALVAALRTNNFFPIEPYADKIAESVMALYNSADDDSTELFFDDADLLPMPEE